MLHQAPIPFRFGLARELGGLGWPGVALDWRDWRLDLLGLLVQMLGLGQGRPGRTRGPRHLDRNQRKGLTQRRESLTSCLEQGCLPPLLLLRAKGGQVPILLGALPSHLLEAARGANRLRLFLHLSSSGCQVEEAGTEGREP